MHAEEWEWQAGSTALHAEEWEWQAGSTALHAEEKEQDQNRTAAGGVGLIRLRAGFKGMGSRKYIILGLNKNC